MQPLAILPDGGAASASGAYGSLAPPATPGSVASGVTHSGSGVYGGSHPHGAEFSPSSSAASSPADQASYFAYHHQWPPPGPLAGSPPASSSLLQSMGGAFPPPNASASAHNLAMAGRTHPWHHQAVSQSVGSMTSGGGGAVSGATPMVLPVGLLTYSSPGLSPPRVSTPLGEEELILDPQTAELFRHAWNGVQSEKAASCHACKTTKPMKNLVYCTRVGDAVRKRRCRKKFCDSCLVRTHNIRIPLLSSWEVAHWVCPACLALCTCAACNNDARKRPWTATPGIGPPTGPQQGGPIPPLLTGPSSSPPLQASPPYLLPPHSAYPLGMPMGAMPPGCTPALAPSPDGDPAAVAAHRAQLQAQIAMLTEQRHFLESNLARIEQQGRDRAVQQQQQQQQQQQLMPPPPPQPGAGPMLWFPSPLPPSSSTVTSAHSSASVPLPTRQLPMAQPVHIPAPGSTSAPSSTRVLASPDGRMQPPVAMQLPLQPQVHSPPILQSQSHSPPMAMPLYQVGYSNMPMAMRGGGLYSPAGAATQPSGDPYAFSPLTLQRPLGDQSAAAFQASLYAQQHQQQQAAAQHAHMQQHVSYLYAHHLQAQQQQSHNQSMLQQLYHQNQQLYQATQSSGGGGGGASLAYPPSGVYSPFAPFPGPGASGSPPLAGPSPTDRDASSLSMLASASVSASLSPQPPPAAPLSVKVEAVEALRGPSTGAPPSHGPSLAHLAPSGSSAPNLLPRLSPRSLPALLTPSPAHLATPVSAGSAAALLGDSATPATASVGGHTPGTARSEEEEEESEELTGDEDRTDEEAEAGLGAKRTATVKKERASDDESQPMEAVPSR